MKRKHLLQLLLAGIVVAIGLTGWYIRRPVDCGAACATQVTQVLKTVPAAEFNALSLEPGVTVIDVRTAEEYNQGHLSGAINLDFNNQTAFSAGLSQLDPQKTYLIYCRSGNRSGKALEQMRSAGFQRVYDLDGGVQAWQAAGLPLEK